ncbi:hypothetical protein [Tenacibaculum ovolyticum]|uniref:hypothetical protein n=1 Tax=Tenacibaculum ovolyticum TaxID=104270 RepID=UPI00041267D4|nr:hypothetical protein [Tenacibaculum ovolyticum]
MAMYLKKVNEIDKEVERIKTCDTLSDIEKLYHLTILKNELINIKKSVKDSRKSTLKWYCLN